MPFRKAIVFSLTLLIASIAATSLFLSEPSERARNGYAKLMRLQTGKKEKTNENAEQKRTNVSKQLLYNQNQQRLQTRLKSDQSFLTFQQTSKGVDLIEEFDGLQGEIQEKKGMGPEHNERCFQFLKSEKGTYSYHTGILEATDVALTRCLIKEEPWPELANQLPSPLFKGQAKTVHLSLIKGPCLKIQGLKASLFEWDDEYP